MKLVLSEDEIQYLKDNYAVTKNKYLMSRLGIGKTSLVKLSKELGLSKIPNYREVFGKVAGKYTDGRANNRPSDTAIKNSHEKLRKLWCDKEFRERRAVAQSASQKARLKSERRRVIFGLEQQTAWKVFAAPRAKSDCRYRLRQNGYIIGHDENVAYYTDATRRVSRTEDTAKKYGIKIQKL